MNPVLTPKPKLDYRPLFALPVIVSALGFFVDVYDMLIFSVVRVPSLQSLGLSPEAVSRAGTLILNAQQAGLLIGGFLWGILGDRRGRMSVLFGSILTYSLTNILCGFVQDINTYAVLRFVAGVGLSGEIGAAVVLVAERLPRELRGYGTSVVAGVGYLGAGAAYLTATWFAWRMAFWVGGGMGLVLLLLRVSVLESALFRQTVTYRPALRRGDFRQFFSTWPAFVKYARFVALGIPTWFIVAILATFANELGEALAMPEPVKPGLCITLVYIGMAVSDLLSGPLSQVLRSRKRVLAAFMALGATMSVLYLLGASHTTTGLYAICLGAGLGTGYIAMYLTMVAESYGTNLRATATTSSPSVVRGLVIPMTLAFQGLKPTLGALGAAGFLGVVAYGLAFWSLSRVRETYGDDLDFVEE